MEERLPRLKGRAVFRAGAVSCSVREGFRHSAEKMKIYKLFNSCCNRNALKRDGERYKVPQILKRGRIRVTLTKAKSARAARLTSERRKNGWAYALKKHKYLYLMLLPGIIYFIVFCYVPMGGIAMAFQDFKFKAGIFGSPWVGLKHFETFFNYMYCWRLIRNTLLLNLTNFCWSFPITILFALLVNEVREGKFKKSITTISYMPHFVSSVIVVSMFFNFLTPNTGIVNLVVRALGGDTVNFLTDPKWFRTVYNTIGIWQETGWSAVIYIAALSGIDQSLYEAAHMDGAGKIRQCIHISLPGIAPTIVVMMIMTLGGILSSGTERILLLYNTNVYETADVIGTYIYRRGLIDNDYSFSTAVGLFQSLIGLIMMIGANKAAKRINGSGIF